jgi:hypothetical protein
LPSNPEAIPMMEIERSRLPPVGKNINKFYHSADKQSEKSL